MIALVVVLGVYRQVLLSQIPDAKKIIPVRMSRDDVPIPRRPGTKGIRIVGPPRQVLRFQIDFTKNPEPLDWQFLERTDRRADVIVEGAIDAGGHFSIAKLHDNGHPQAGHYIRQVLSTWKFKQYKKGTIRYYFNVPTRQENMKIQIDARGLQRNLKFVGDADVVQTGVLCYAFGILSKNIMVVK